MNLVDSSGWLEYFADSKNAKNFSAPIQDIKDLIVSAINIYEVFKKVLIQTDENSALQAIAIMQQATIVDVNSQIGIEAAKISAENSIPMADSIIIATARSHNATIWTQDADFKDFENVKYFKK
jgi:predicted nucleic acid-binding protein